MVTIDVKALLEVLVKIKPGLATREMGEGATHFVFSKNQVVTFNHRISISHPFPMDIRCSVRSREFYDLLQGLKGVEGVGMELRDSQLILEAPRTKAGFAVMLTPEVLTIVEKMGLDAPHPWKPLPRNFLQGTYMTSFSISNDPSQGWMNCFVVKENGIYSSDDYRISRFLFEAPLEDSFLLPLNSGMLLKEYAPVEYAIIQGWIHFRNGAGVVISSALLEEEVPDLDPFFGVLGQVMELGEDVGKSMERVEALVQEMVERDRVVEVVIREGKVKFRTERAGVGWIEEVLNFPESGEREEICFLINPTFLREVFTLVPRMIIGRTVCEFSSGNFSHVMSLPTHPTQETKR